MNTASGWNPPSADWERKSMWNLKSLAQCVLDAPQDRGINVGLARDLARAALVADEALRAIVKESETAPYGRDTRMALIARRALSTEAALQRPTVTSGVTLGEQGYVRRHRPACPPPESSRTTPECLVGCRPAAGIHRTDCPVAGCPPPESSQG